MLRFAWSTGAFTTNDAMPVVGLTRSTTIEAIEALIDLGLVRELSNARAVGEYRIGRPARRFELRENAGLLIGVDAGRFHLTATVADLRGKALATVRVDSGIEHGTDAHDRPDGWEARREATARVVDEALARVARPRSEVLAICAGVPAPVDSDGRSPEGHNPFWRLMNPDLVTMLRAWAPIVRVDNDAALAAVAEREVGAARGLDSFVALLAGERLGAGVFVDGNLLRGVHGGAGEAHAFVRVEGVGSPRGLGYLLGMWAHEAIATGRLRPDHPLAGTPELADARTVLALAEAGDAWAKGLVARAGERLARIVGMFGSFYDPSRVVVSGAISGSVGGVVAAAKARMGEVTELPAPDIVASSLGADVVWTGAVFAALAEARAHVLSLRDGTRVTTGASETGER